MRAAPPTPSRREPDWRDNAPCKDDPDAMFPSSNAYEIEQAKAYCRMCPAVERCLQWALETGEEHGVWGGLSEKERRRLRRRAARPISVDDYTNSPRSMHASRTLDEAWAEFTEEDGDHVTPNQAAFRLDRGRLPDGPVLRTCGVDGCVKPSHLEDNPERQRCGTRAGYERHRRDGEVACADCRRANADSDNRLRRTGTTKAAVSA